MLIDNTTCNIGHYWKIFRESFTIIAIAISFTSTLAFNLDPSSYVTYNGPSNSFFGFAVTGYIDYRNESLVLVGAPQDSDEQVEPNYKGGAVYTCDADKADSCSRIKILDNFTVKEENRMHQWLGATLTTSGSNGIVMACAPRYWYRLNKYSNPVGFCYYTPGGGSLNFRENYSPCRVLKGKEMTYDRLGSGQAGFSAAISKESDRIYIGAVGSYVWEGKVFAKNAQGTPNAKETPMNYTKSEDTYMGYSMTSMKIVGKVKSGIAVGIPRALNVSGAGQVEIFTHELKRVTLLNGTKYPDYFGYSVCASDVDGDGADDLIIGAPMHSNSKNDRDYDKGRIYIFYQGKTTCKESDTKCETKRFEKYDFIDGLESGARFGSALASLGDINKDGYEDIAVSAPYEGTKEDNKTCRKATPTTGAVYIYLGSKNGLSKSPSQVIKASNVSNSSKASQLNAFGHSLSGGLDLDKNQYPDLVVGAYESDAVFLFKSRPVIKLNASLSFLINTTKRGKNIPLARNTCTSKTKNENHVCVTLEMCMQYSGIGVEDRIEITTDITLDTKYRGNSRMRFLNNDSKISKSVLTLIKNNKLCKNETVYVDNTDTDIDKVTPLEASLQYDLDESKNKKALPGILDYGPKTRRDSFNISTNCGDDDICYPDLKLTIIPNIKQYEPLSNVEYFHLQVLVKNNGEEAYGSQIALQMPKGLEYYTHADGPQSNRSATMISFNNENLTFSIGNTLFENQMVNFNLTLHINKTFQDLNSTYHFWAKVNSTNREKNATLNDNEFSFDISINETVSLQIISKSNDQTSYNHSQYRTKTVRNDTEAGPKAIHQYIIKNSGTANLSEVSAIFFWPMKLTNGGDLLYLMDKPRTRGSIQCDGVTNVNYKNLTRVRPYKDLIELPNNSTSNSTIPLNSKNTYNNTVSFNGTDYQKIRCVITNLSRDQEVSVLFPSVVWMETIKKIAGLRNKSIEIGSRVEVKVIRLLRNVTQIPDRSYIRDTITTIELIKSLQPDVIPLWIVVGSSVLGVLILMAMIYGLYKCGFFNRHRPPTFSGAENHNVDDFTSEDEDEKEL